MGRLSRSAWRSCTVTGGVFEQSNLKLDIALGEQLGARQNLRYINVFLSFMVRKTHSNLTVLELQYLYLEGPTAVRRQYNGAYW